MDTKENRTMNAIIKGSIGQIAKDSGKTIAETFVNADAVVLVDTSGSMSTTDAPGGVSVATGAAGLGALGQTVERLLLATG
jgi:Mg-chelatase subunit ChlD